MTFESGRRLSVAVVTELTVSQLARRSGVPATTLRFYEQAGLLPADRSPAGYRLYDEAALDRLAFIATAKGLGLPLAEVRALLVPWQDGMCVDVQAELEPLLARRVADTDARLDELTEFRRRLEQARAHLASIDRVGPCDRSCTFLHREPAAGGAPSARVRDEFGPSASPDPQGGTADPAPIACTLSGADRALQLRRWRGMLGGVSARQAVPRGMRVVFDPSVTPVSELADLAAAEARCCAFLTVALHLGQDLVLEVTGPEDAAGVIADLFGPVPG